MALRFVRNNPTLAPLFAAVGAGCVGAVWFGIHNLVNSPDVITQRWKNPQPYNNVRQDQNTKLWSPNKEFWASRAGLPDPSAAFMQAEDAVMKGTGRAVQKVKEMKSKAVKAVENVTSHSTSAKS